MYRIQEEVHRFTISKMRAAKRRTIKHSSLEKINGIGPEKAKKILAHFGGLAGVKKAGVDDGKLFYACRPNQGKMQRT